MGRLSRDELYTELMQLMSRRSTCERAQVGCVIVKEGRIITTGYNSSPSSMLHCTDVGCLQDDSGRCIRTVHAEAGAISFAAKQGIALEGTTLYVTMSPCLDCAKLIINAGISAVIYLDEYRKKDGINLLSDAGIRVEHLRGDTQ